MPFFRGADRRANDLSKWPILSREDVQSNREALRDNSRDPEELQRDATGGSTGEPVRFYLDGRLAAGDVCFRTPSARMVGASKPWSRMAILWGDDRELGAVSKKERWLERLLGRVHLNAFDVSPEDLQSFRARLVKHRPAIVQGYATALELIATHLVEHDEQRVRPSFLRSAAESLMPGQREVITGAFGRPVCDVYGSRESAGLAAQCPHGGIPRARPRQSD